MGRKQPLRRHCVRKYAPQPGDRSAGAELIRQAGYDINIAAARLQQQYLQLGGEA